MKRLLVLVSFLVLFTPGSWGAPCDTTTQQPTASTQLEAAAMGLGAGEWCKMAPNIEGGAALVDLLSTCIIAQSDWIQNYAGSMGYDSANQTIYFYGTPHGGAAGFIKYVAADNVWYAISSDEVAYPSCTATTCDASPLWSSTQSACASCDASHAYDANAWDGSNLYYQSQSGGTIFKWNGTSWDNSWETCNGGSGSTGAIAYWPSLGTSGSLVAVCGSNSDRVDYYDLNTDTWTNIATSIFAPTYHTQIEYHPTADVVWIQQGNSGTTHYKLWLDGGTPTLTALSTAPSGRLGITTSKCVADSGSDDKFVCWDMSENNDDVEDEDGWYEYDIGSDTWTSFTTLGITSMPNLYTLSGDMGSTPVTMADITDLGVSVWLADEYGGEGERGMYVYKHTISEATETPPADPGSLRVKIE